MKKIRVYSLIRISFAVQALILILSVVISISGVINLPWIVASINMSSILIALASSSGIISKYDFYKRFDGEIIDEYEVVTWTKIIKTRWIVLFVVQLTFIFLNHLLIEYLALPFVEGWSLGKEHTVPHLFKMILTLSPSIIFVFGSFIWRINKSEEELIKFKRRDRIRTEDLESLDEKVDLKKWLSDDILLKTDKELILKLVSIDEQFLFKADDNLLDDKKFILDLIKRNEYAILYISEDYKKDIEVILEYIKKFPENVALIEVINKSVIDHPSVSPFIINQTEEEKKIAMVKFLAIMKMKEMLGK